jgi:tetratricopeptide (TPR) repeat protein
LAQDHPMVAYFRGYCREKLGESSASDYAEAARMKSTYVFPDSEEEFSALSAALKENEKDANAHALLGDWYFARGEADLALGAWNRARTNNQSLPIVDASVGLALLRIRENFAGALEAFEQGVRNDPRNVTNYEGAVAATTLLGKPPAERVRILEHYPDFEAMPTNLVFELALSRAEAGDYRGAVKMFDDRFFGREEGGTNVRAVWIEVKLSEALALSRAGRCDEALQIATSLGKPVAGLPFTENGLQAILESARNNYLVGEVLSACGQKIGAEQRYEKASQSTELSEIVWAWAAARKRTGYDAEKWRGQLESSLSQAEARIRTSSFKGWWTYNVATLQIALGQLEQGKNTLRAAILLPESLMSYHFSRLALAGATPRN